VKWRESIAAVPSILAEQRVDVHFCTCYVNHPEGDAAPTAFSFSFFLMFDAGAMSFFGGGGGGVVEKEDR
jgi:hypothetical protein